MTSIPGSVEGEKGRAVNEDGSSTGSWKWKDALEATQESARRKDEHILHCAVPASQEVLSAARVNICTYLCS